MSQNLSRQLKILFYCCLLLPLGLAGQVRAELTVVVEGTGSSQLPLALVNFSGDRTLLGERALLPIIRNDLARTGAFRFIDTSFAGDSMTETSDPRYADWQSRGAHAILLGSVTGSGNELKARFRLLDATRQTELAGLSFSMEPGQYRQVAHRIADIVYEKLTGRPGDFSSQIAYVLKRGKGYELHVADADGHDAARVLSSREPIMSPSWSPDGGRLAYVSFENRRAVVYVHTLATGQRKAVAALPGNNSAPAWSPDGRRLAVALSKDGLSQIYVINADGGTPVRLTRSLGIDTEPVWAPDGQSIYFTSDRGGSPQIYRTTVASGDTQRITFEGNYNVSPDISPDGKSLALIRRTAGRFQLVVHDLATGVGTVLTTTADDESPAFSPNGSTILYATREGGREVLAAVSVDGRVRQRLTLASGDVREPAWGPQPRQ